jgi:hypothetical protein
VITTIALRIIMRRNRDLLEPIRGAISFVAWDKSATLDRSGSTGHSIERASKPFDSFRDLWLRPDEG